ncbi:TIGR03619 family F420-dependent LLM class oxidoreductase [Allokutzneria albata]|uniref:Probable F420-dependent oxidoreductase, Rv2161c family n=1 Tax=Allokutzneria albata TaxID=211114 RepID=A0A1G9TMC1_ALLAB|nr:TIGR03619 family F420-dependent LLM class oxidoreductase [Allokutzneria albata]SDM48574.1 probable F420-dependent oxidoreductase, Rv2161c family [Allokutzneria albata]
MKVGLALRNGAANVDGRELVAAAVRAEEAGLDSVWVMDRWLRPHAAVDMPGVPVPVTMPADSYSCVFDPIETLAFVAARTERILLGTSAINALYHPPVLLARRLATLDQLSGGRVIAGLTSGWMAEEFSVAGVSSQVMGHGLDDHVAAMRAVWGPDPVTHNGEHYPIPASDIGPKPLQDKGIPIVIGYTTSAGARRAARIGDGIHPYRNDFDLLAADISVAAGKPVVLRTDAGAGILSGSVRQWVDGLARLQELGVDHVLVQLDGDHPVEVLAAAARALRESEEHPAE